MAAEYTSGPVLAHLVADLRIAAAHKQGCIDVAGIEGTIAGFDSATRKRRGSDIATPHDLMAGFGEAEIRNGARHRPAGKHQKLHVALLSAA
ncbi:unannotated protein [freshwater metagenome]|uniref:Unannotated protein n=1 Tax=freshwater metagenome TaxID=449393 RepID=A0A6J6HSY9_9ZZZZ